MPQPNFPPIPTTSTSMLDLALSYAVSGIPIFPVRPADEETVDPATGEIITYSAKSPYTTYGLKEATVTPRIISRWWEKWPDAMVGMPTGEKVGFWVLDVDQSDAVDGSATLAELEQQNGDLPATLTVETPSGGRHYLFRMPPQEVHNRGRFAHGLDTRGSGGYVIAAGSRRADGRAYEWINDAPIADAPQWLLDLVVKRHAAPANGTTAPSSGYVAAAVESEIAELESVRSGRNDALNRAAFSLGQFVGAGALGRAEAEARLYAAAEANGYVQKDGAHAARATIASGLERGEQVPRLVPEEISPEHAARMASGLLSAPARVQMGGAEQDATDGEQGAADSSKSEKTIQTSDTDVPLIRATQFKWLDPSTLPRRDFVYGTHLIRKYVSVTVSPGGIGKTSLSIAEALAMVSNRPLLGVKPLRPLKLWLWNSEDPRDEMERRIMAAAIHYKLKPEQLTGLFLDTGREQDLVVAYDDRRGVKIATPIVEAVIDQIKANKIDVMIIDPFVSTHAVSENDNGAIDKVAKLWAKIADQTNCAIELIHHVRKNDGRDITVEDARGAVSLLAAARSARVLNRMSEEQATAANVPLDERFSYFAVSRGKANLAPMTGRAEWRHLISVPLGNGRGFIEPQDHAGVVTAWEWPGAEEITGAITDEQLEMIKVQLDNGEHKRGTAARNWAGSAIAYVLGLDMEDASQKKRAGTVLKALMDEGQLVEVEERDPVSRAMAKFVRSAEYGESVG